MRYRPMLASDIGAVPMSCFGNVERTRDGVRSPRGLWHPMYWLDFGGHAPPMERDTICVCCYHVGQLETGEERDARYQGRGIGTALLDALFEWATTNGFGLIAKATPPVPAVSNVMGGMPAHVYEGRGFATVDRWFDEDLEHAVRERNLAPRDELVRTSTVACCVRRLDDPGR